MADGGGGVGGGGKIILSNDPLCHAHSHPPAHNIRIILDSESCAKKENGDSVRAQCFMFFAI